MKSMKNYKSVFATRPVRTLIAVQLTAAALVANVARAELNPRDAYGRADESGPSDAQEIDLVDFEKLLESGELLLDSPARESSLRDSAIATEADDKALVEKVLSNDPERLKRLLTVDNDRPVADGINGLYDIPDLPGRQTTLLGQRFILGEIAASIRTFPTKENQLAIYEVLWGQLKPDAS